MQSSDRNCFAARLSAASQSRAFRRCGPDGTFPTSAWPAESAAVDKPEATCLCLRLSFAPTPREEAHRRAEPACEHEPRRRPAGGERRELRAELRGHVCCLAELVDRGCELLALSLDLAADVVGGAWHHSLLIAVLVNLASRIACCGTGGEPFLIDRLPSSPSTATSTKRKSVTISSASHVSRNVASPAAIVASRKPRPKTAKTAAAIVSPIPTPSAASFCLTSRAASSSSSRMSALARSETALTAPASPRWPLLVAWVGMSPPVHDLCQEVPADDSSAEHDPRARPPLPLRLRLRPLAELRARRRAPGLTRLLVRRRLALVALHHQAGLQLPEEGRVAGELVRE